MTLLQSLSATLENPWIFIPILIWSLVWKGIALWKTGRNNQIRWFVVLLVLNTVGIVEITYLVWFQRDLNSKKR